MRACDDAPGPSQPGPPLLASTWLPQPPPVWLGLLGRWWVGWSCGWLRNGGQEEGRGGAGRGTESASGWQPGSSLSARRPDWRRSLAAGLTRLLYNHNDDRGLAAGITDAISKCSGERCRQCAHVGGRRGRWRLSDRAVRTQHCGAASQHCMMQLFSRGAAARQRRTAMFANPGRPGLTQPSPSPHPVPPPPPPHTHAQACAA